MDKHTTPSPVDKRLYVALDRDLHKWVRLAAAYDGCSMSEVAVRALRDYSKKNPLTLNPSAA